MKKNISFILAVIFFLPVVSWGQTLLLEENFSYTVGTSLTSNGWSAYSSSGTNPIVIESGNLSFESYPSSSGGSVLVDNTGEDVFVPLSSAQTSGNLYLSFLINFSGITGTAAGDYFLCFGNASAATDYGKLFVKKSGSLFAFGLSKTAAAASATYTGFDYSLNTTYLVIIKYTINASSSNDDVALFVFSSAAPTTEPTATLSPTREVSGDPASIAVVNLRQNSTTTIANIDGIRVATDWSLAPLPVELTSFTGSNTENGVQLNWETATEVNNYGFNVEREVGNRQEAVGNWEKIAFIQGHGNSNSPKSYSFTDAAAPAGKVQYRLTQIDFDGKFEYSNIVEVNVEAPAKLVLYQNSPNPFNPTTEIKFALPKNSNVELSIYNMLGEKVKTLANGMMNAGEHKVSFNASNLSSGVYFYKLTTDNYSSVRKMILTK